MRPNCCKSMYHPNKATLVSLWGTQSHGKKWLECWLWGRRKKLGDSLVVTMEVTPCFLRQKVNKPTPKTLKQGGKHT